MKTLSIQSKLTAWYFIVLIVSFALFRVVALFAMQRGIEGAVDESLRDQTRGVRELMERELSSGYEALEGELRQHSEVQAEADLFQVSDEQGRWIYRSPLMAHYNLPVPGTGDRSTYDVQISGLLLRVLVTKFSVSGQTYQVQVAASMNDFYDAMERFKWVLLLSSPFLLAVASAGGYWMSRRALTPVDEIIKAAQNINSRNLSRRLIVPQSGDELQRLSETLNGMLRRLETSFNKITRFTADASHDLRTPVALMRTTAELSLLRSCTEAEYREDMTQILGEAEKTSVLVEKLMMLARADMGADTLQRAPIDLAESLQEACCEGCILAEAKHITFLENRICQAVIVDGDAHMLHRMFLILIDNAVKYTPSHGQIEISLRCKDESAIAEVRDNGIGIDPSDLPYIFDRFYRADKARSHESGGTGLGLSIAHWVAEAHGGSIEVQSTPGAGSAFQVWLPLLKR
jgi:heavy metal sensor kinase